MEFQRSMFAEAWVVLKQCWAWALGIAAIGFFVNYLSVYHPVVLENPFGYGFIWIVGSGFIWIFLAYRAHTSILMIERSISDHASWSFRFFFRSLLVSFICFLPIILFYIVFLANEAYFRGALLSGVRVRITVGWGTTYFYAGLFALIAVAGLMSMLGTYLPAYVAQKGVGFKAAIQRGKRQWWYVLWRSVVVTILTVVAFIICAYLFYSLLQYNLGSAGSNFGNLAKRLQLVNLWMQLPIYFVSAFITVLIPVILCRAYLRDEAMQNTE